MRPLKYRRLEIATEILIRYSAQIVDEISNKRSRNKVAADIAKIRCPGRIPCDVKLQGN